MHSLSFFSAVANGTCKHHVWRTPDQLVSTRQIAARKCITGGSRNSNNGI